MTYRVCILLAFFGIIIVAGLNAQQIIEISSFQAAAKLALKDNTDITNGTLDIAGKKQQFREALSEGLPQISASGKINDNTVIPTSVYPDEFFGGPAGELTAVQIEPVKITV